MITRVLVGILLFLPTLHATVHAEPKLRVYARADKAEYVLGEPVRLTVSICNLSPDTLLANVATTFFAVTPPRGPVERVAKFDSFVPTRARLAPGDSLLFFLYPNAHDETVDEDGVPLASPGVTRTFPVAGTHVVRVSCKLGISQDPFVYGVPDPSLVVSSNPVTLRIRPAANRLEERVTDALWRARAVGASYWRGWNDDRHPRDQNLNRLRAVKVRVTNTPLMAHLDYAIARMLLDLATEFPSASQRDLLEGMSILDDLYSGDPEFRHDEVTYHLVMAHFRAHIAGVPAAQYQRARKMMDKLMRDQPELWANPEYALLANRVADTDDEIKVRLMTDKRDYLIGEPMLFRMSLVNCSSRTIHVPGPAFWLDGREKSSRYLEIERPDAGRELRGSSWSTSHSGSSERYSGVPLAPGDSLTFEWHPVITAGLKEKWGYRRPSALGRAFAEPGTYRVRGGFRAPDVCWRLWGTGRMTLSRPVVINVRTPDAREARILDAIPRRSGPWRVPPEDIARMEDALRADPDNPLADHLRIALADAYRMTALVETHDSRGVLDMLAGTNNSDVPLWRDHVRVAQLEAYRDLRREHRVTPDQELALEQLVADATKDNPGLWSAYDFYWNALGALYGEAGVFHFWEERLHRRGVGPPSRRELEELFKAAAATNARRGLPATVKQLRPMKPVRRQHGHIHR